MGRWYGESELDATFDELGHGSGLEPERAAAGLWQFWDDYSLTHGPGGG